MTADTDPSGRPPASEQPANGASREVVVLGTASQAPTRTRNHNGYVLRFDDDVTLFDPGEGTQRQMLLAGVRAPSLRRICITHLHGDHCLGLPGVVQRLSLDRAPGPVDVYFPSSGEPFIERLRHAAIFDEYTPLRIVPTDPGLVDPGPPLRLTAAALDHAVDTLGWRLEEPPSRTMLPDRLDALGIEEGPDRSRLQHDGRLVVQGREIRLEDVSVEQPGQVVAFVMDTRPCQNALMLAENADLVIAEATFRDEHAELAHRYGHMTARQAGRLAHDAGAKRLVLTHFSQRYQELATHQREAEEEFDDVWIAEDLARVPLPERVRPADA